MARTSPASAPASTPGLDAPLPVADFESALGELETLVGRMEEGELGLDDSLGAFERGIALYRQCRSALDQAELKVRQLLDPLDPDSATPFDADPS
ncbi:MAG: exodeoxyribonuclease VII small subunit [Xanthomonadales bacterium]|nr:exodeoxyribonuclease VII small subunit [Xanthomonadales bacterium]